MGFPPCFLIVHVTKKHKYRAVGELLPVMATAAILM